LILNFLALVRHRGFLVRDTFLQAPQLTLQIAPKQNDTFDIRYSFRPSPDCKRLTTTTTTTTINFSESPVVSDNGYCRNLLSASW
jgi:hypothetical protein